MEDKYICKVVLDICLLAVFIITHDQIPSLTNSFWATQICSLYSVEYKEVN